MVGYPSFTRLGKSRPSLDNCALGLQLHFSIELRLIDITNSNDGDFCLLGPYGLLQWRAIAKDGADLPPSQAVVKDAQQEFAPGEIYDFEYTPRGPGMLRLEVANSGLNSKVVQPIDSPTDHKG